MLKYEVNIKRQQLKLQQYVQHIMFIYLKLEIDTRNSDRIETLLQLFSRWSCYIYFSSPFPTTCHIFYSLGKGVR